MSTKVTRQLKEDFDFCMHYWKSLKDGFSDDDALEAKQVVRDAVEQGRGEDCEKWFAMEAAMIRGVLSEAHGINERIRARVVAESLAPTINP